MRRGPASPPAPTIAMPERQFAAPTVATAARTRAVPSLSLRERQLANLSQVAREHLRYLNDLRWLVTVGEK
jgi:hypothetical protein